jgi:hypothetical protein
MITSENKKIDCKALLVDMSFYASGGRFNADFDFREFWVKDDSSRLSNLRRSLVWNFEDDFAQDSSSVTISPPPFQEV